MLATQLNSLVTSNAIQKNGIIRLTKYLCNTVSGRRIVILLSLEIVSGDIGFMIGICKHTLAMLRQSGNPVGVREDGAVEEQPAALAAAPQPTVAPHTYLTPAAPPAAVNHGTHLPHLQLVYHSEPVTFPLATRSPCTR